jgi:hypothetical protein
MMTILPQKMLCGQAVWGRHYVGRTLLSAKAGPYRNISMITEAASSDGCASPSRFLSFCFTLANP